MRQRHCPAAFSFFGGAQPGGGVTGLGGGGGGRTQFGNVPVVPAGQT
ncbi:hypothetical protein [Bradyrhizobium sp.]|nr:hypothetical protein [Bradyrhizobium sp.]MDO9296722.1 hypothetical protein [Bradyrhizobium sp.]